MESSLLNPMIQTEAPELPVEIQHVTRRKSASARIQGAKINITVPQHWSKNFKQDACKELTSRLRRQFQRDWELLQQAQGPWLTFEEKKVFTRWVEDLNARTLKLPLKGVRIGSARHTRLAQMNTRTQVMTVSRYCLEEVPESALRYLVLHELAHIKIPNHSKAFWSEVKAFVPDLKYQQRLISAVHHIRLYEADCQNPPLPKTEAVQPNPVKPPEGFLQQLLFKLF